MTATARTLDTFPSVRLPSQSGGLPVEVVLIAQIGIGAGSPLIASTAALQRGHDTFVDALDEPSARIGGADFQRGDATSLYSFVVGPEGHPFHRHAGHRVFTAISGSGGAMLRFSTASQDQIDADPQAFLRALRHVEIPPDCLFTVRFGGGTWHQFLPRDAAAGHPALFALSCHTNELGGELDAEQRRRVLSNEADIPTLTELLPESVAALLATANAGDVPTITLSLTAATTSLRGRFCARTRGLSGRLRRALGRWRRPVGCLADSGAPPVVELTEPPPQSLLWRQFGDTFTHQDSFALEIDAAELPTASASQLLAGLLDGFLENRPTGVSRLMGLRNVLVKPLGLRTSPLGCPVSSLLNDAPQRFAGRFPVLEQSIDADDRRAQVVLGADDKHLRFRSCAGVERLPCGKVRFTLGTRVRNRNLFGAVYMRLIDRTHRRYVAPAMLSMAVNHLLAAPAPRRAAAAAFAWGDAR
ncbi:MAG: DUF2867 domain-containing protein [Pseudomonadota bacterium]